jgi:hypothetical protein
MNCWICGVEVDDTNSSGDSRFTGLHKNECIGCHSVYNLFYKIRKTPLVKANENLSRFMRIVQMYKMSLSYPDMSVKELSKKFVEGR